MSVCKLIDGKWVDVDKNSWPECVGKEEAENRSATLICCSSCSDCYGCSDCYRCSKRNSLVSVNQDVRVENTKHLVLISAK